VPRGGRWHDDDANRPAIRSRRSGLQKCEQKRLVAGHELAAPMEPDRAAHRVPVASSRGVTSFIGGRTSRGRRPSSRSMPARQLMNGMT
jgi:hypothetical protein